MNRIVSIVVLAIAVSGCSTWRHAGAPEGRTMTAGVYEYQIPSGWTYQVSKDDVLLVSRDGPRVQHAQSRFYVWGRTVIDDPERQKLTESMLLSDVADQLLALRRRELGLDTIETLSLEPATVAGMEAFRAEYTYRTIDGISFKGVSYGAMRPSGVYAIRFEAPMIHFFERDRPAFESMVRSMRRLAESEWKEMNRSGPR